MPHIVHDPTITETISAVREVLTYHALARSEDAPPEADAAFRGATIELVELLCDAVEQRLARRHATAEVSAQLKLAQESEKIAS